MEAAPRTVKQSISRALSATCRLRCRAMAAPFFPGVRSMGTTTAPLRSRRRLPEEGLRRG